MKPCYFNGAETDDSRDPAEIERESFVPYVFESDMNLLISSDKKRIIDFNLVDLNERLIDYIMRSSMNDIFIIKSEYQGKIVRLVIIPTLKIGIDLVYLKKEDLFTNKPVLNKPKEIYDDLMDELVDSELKKHDDPNLKAFVDPNGIWTFYTIDDTICKNSDNYFISLDICKKLNKPYQRLWKGDIVPATRDIKIACAPMVSVFLNNLYQGVSNWACGQSYNDVYDNLKKSRLEEDIMCYEHSKDFLEESYRLTENKPLQLECLDKYSSDKTIIMLSLLDSDNKSVRFLGKYKIDKEASKEKGYMSFKLQEEFLEL
jgi:hypothetical protein